MDINDIIINIIEIILYKVLIFEIKRIYEINEKIIDIKTVLLCVNRHKISQHMPSILFFKGVTATDDKQKK